MLVMSDEHWYAVALIFGLPVTVVLNVFARDNVTVVSGVGLFVDQKRTAETTED